MSGSQGEVTLRRPAVMPVRDRRLSRVALIPRRRLPTISTPANTSVMWNTPEARGSGALTRTSPARRPDHPRLRGEQLSGDRIAI